MRKKLMKLFAMAALLMAPAVATATTDSLTVADGTTTNGYIPIYGYYVDAAQHNQIVYPADSISAIAGNNITGLTFYMSGVSGSSWNTTVTVSLGIVEATNCASLITDAELTEVWQGVVTGMDAVLDISFDEAFPYTDGNLLVDIQTTPGSYSSTSFYGVSLTSGSYLSYSWNSTSQDFMPKTKFTYSDQPICRKPKNLQVSDLANDGFTISWTSAAGDNVQYYSVLVDGVEVATNITDTFYTLGSLEANTDYNVWVRTVCGEGDSSGNLSGSFRTLCQNGNCEIHVSGASPYYGSANVYQNGSLLQSVTGSATIDICNGDSLVVLFVNGQYGSSSTITVTDVADIALADAWSRSAHENDTILAIENGCPSCIPPTAVYADSIGAYTASIHWTDQNIDGIGDYAIYVNGELVAEVSGDTVYDLTELSASTNVTVGVSRICEEGDTSGARTVSFRTDCGSVTLPYFEDFEGLGFTASNGLIVPCWIRDEAYSCTTGGRTFPCGSTGSIPGGGTTATMAFTADPGVTILIATDTIPVSGDSVFVSFKAQPNGNVDFWCGVMTDPHDSSTFIPIGAGIHTTNANNTWGEYVFSTVGFNTDESYRVAFKYCGTGYTGNWVNIDDIEIRVFDGCIRPMNLHTDTVTTESAVLDWEVYGTEDSWLLTVNDEDPVVITEHPYTLEGLEANTVYNVSIRALCQSGDTTDATGTSFRTPCEGDTCVVTAVVPYTNYEIIQNGSSFGIVEGSYYGETYNLCHGTEIYLHTTELGSSYYDVTVVNAAGIELYTGTLADSALLDTMALGQPCPSCMPATNLTVSDITAEGCTFSWQPMGDSANVQSWKVYVDGELVGTSTETSYNITNLGANSTFELGVRADCGDEDSSVLRTTEVHTLCSDGNCEFTVNIGSYYSGTVNVWQDNANVASIDYYDNNGDVSLCLGSEIVLTYQAPSYSYGAYGFTVVKGDSILVSVGDASGYNTGDTIVVFDGQCNATVYDIPAAPGSSCDTITGLTATATDNTIVISFSGTASTYEVGYVEGAAWNESNAWTDQTYSTTYTFSDLEAGTEYTVGVRAECYYNYSYIYSEWVTLTVSTTGGSNPGTDTCHVPTGLQTMNIDSTRAVVAWTPGGGEEAWQLKINNNEQSLIDATSTTYVMSNLEPETQYSVSVRAVCGTGNYSDWSAELSFTTLASPTDEPGDTTGIADIDGIVSAIYPNPASSIVYIETSEEAMVSLVDLNGREIYRSVASATWHRIDISNMTKGAYFVRIVSKEGTAVRKLIVK